MIENNFYYKNKLNSCMIFDNDILKKLPKTFHLFIEVGLNVFDNTFSYKGKQINKYIAIINLSKVIKNEKIKNIYKQQFQENLKLNLNSVNNKISNNFVFMIIGNDDYHNFATRFLDQKTFANDTNEINVNDEFKKLLPKNSNEFLFCGYVDFKQGINSNRGLNIKLELQKKELKDTHDLLINQKSEFQKQLEAQKNELEDGFKKQFKAQKNELEDGFKNKLEAQKNELEDGFKNKLKAQKNELEDGFKKQFKAQEDGFKKQLEAQKSEIDKLKAILLQRKEIEN